MSDLHQCGCGCPPRNVLPDVLTVDVTFSGVSIPGAFGAVSFELRRSESSQFVIGDDGEPVSVSHRSGFVDVGSVLGHAEFGLIGTTLWMRIGDAGIAFQIYVGTPVAKFTSAISAAGPEVVIANPFNSTQTTAPITDSWSSIAAQIVSAGLAVECGAFWLDSLPNGWDLATLVPIADRLLISSQNIVVTDPKDVNTAFALAFNSRYYGGEIVWHRSPFQESTATRLNSIYGAGIQYALRPAGGKYFSNTSGGVPSFLHGAAPYAAIATGRTGTVGTLMGLGSLNLQATLLAVPAATQHPKPFVELTGDLPCSDCGTGAATMRVTPTLPYRDGVQVSADLWSVNAHRLDLADCPLTCLELGFVARCSTEDCDPDKYRYEHPITGAVYDRRGVVTAVVQAQVVDLEFRLSLSASPPATFRLAVNGTQTATISTTATATDVANALIALANVDPGDVVCADGPLPLPITITWQGNFLSPRIFTFTATGATLTSLARRVDLAHFSSDAPADTNYATATPGDGEHLTHIKTTAMLRDQRESENVLYLDVDFDAPEVSLAPLEFRDGANLVTANCLARYRNTPYESVTATISGVSYGSGIVCDLFWPNDLISGATAPIETTGTVAAPTSFAIGPSSMGMQTYSAQIGGKDGLLYRGYGGNTLYGGKYLSASGDCFCQSLIKISAGDGLGLTDWFFTAADPGVSTSTEFDRVGAAIKVCTNDIVNFTSVFKRAAQAGPGWNSGIPPFTDYCITEYFPNTITSTFGGLTGTTGGVLGTNNGGSGPTTIYKQFGNPGTYGPGYAGAYCTLALPMAAGVKDGPFTDLEFVGYQIIASNVSIDPCNGRVECTINYRVFWIRRVPIESSGDFLSETPPFSYYRLAFFQYGFADNHVATFSAAVSTDLSLRPNINKDRVITLTFESDLTTGRYYLAPDLSGSASRKLEAMPSSGDWAAFAAYMASMPYASFPRLTNAVVNCGAMPYPGSVAAPNVINFSGASVAVTLEPQAGAHDVMGCASSFTYTLPDSLPADWAGEHTLIADINEPHWIEEVAVAPFVKAILSPYDWTLTLFEADCSNPVSTQIVPLTYSATRRAEPRRVVARYRLPCVHWQGFEGNGSNLFELVSADRSVADWPIRLRVDAV